MSVYINFNSIIYKMKYFLLVLLWFIYLETGSLLPRLTSKYITENDLEPLSVSFSLSVCVICVAYSHMCADVFTLANAAQRLSHQVFHFHSLHFLT